LFDMLGRCPQLQDLRIVRQIGAERDLSGFLANLTWPRLTRLILGGIFSFTFSAPSIVTAFLSRHAQLEMLLLFLPRSVDLPVLPRLRYVYTPSFPAFTSFFVGGSVPTAPTAAQLPGLEYLHMITPFGIETDTNIIIRNFTTFPSLRGMTVAFLMVPSLERFSRAVPQLERLAFETSPWNNNVERGTQTNLPTPECITLLTRFAHLKHLDSSAVINDEDVDADTISGYISPRTGSSATAGVCRCRLEGPNLRLLVPSLVFNLARQPGGVCRLQSEALAGSEIP
ncbi:hypothetical protein DFH09DRAFT_1168907, partial [Mycena vulgaris]